MAADAATVLRSPRSALGATLAMRDALAGWLFVSPVLIGFLVLFVGPLIAVAIYSLQDWNLLTQQATFIGLDNYVNALTQNPDFWQVVRNSLVFALGLVPLNMSLALILALALMRKSFGSIFFRTVFFAPVVTSAVAWAIVWRFLLQGQGGVVNQMLADLGIHGPNWLRDPNWAMVAVIVTRVIKMVGLNMILYIAALQTISDEYTEAARLDGANSWQVFWKITWPLLGPTSLVIMVLTTIGSFKVFDHIYLMTNGGPENGTLVLAFYIYQQAFKFFATGYASALAMIMFVLILILTLIQLARTRRKEL